MTYAALPSEVRLLAERVLTEKQLAAFELECDGVGIPNIGRRLDVTKTAIVDRLDAAHLKLRKAGVLQDASGNWSMSEEVAAA